MSKDSTTSSYLPTFEWAFVHPRYWGTWLGILFAGILAFIPFRLRDKLAEFLAKRLVRMNNRAKKRAVANLEHCFPEKTEEERFAILEQSYINAGCVMLGFATIMMRSKRYLEKRTLFRNEEILTELVDKGEKVILLVPHSWAIDYPAVQLASRGLPVAAMIKKQKNRVADWLMNVQRLKYGGRTHERADGIKPLSNRFAKVTWVITCRMKTTAQSTACSCLSSPPRKPRFQAWVNWPHSAAPRLCR